MIRYLKHKRPVITCTRRSQPQQPHPCHRTPHVSATLVFLPHHVDCFNEIQLMISNILVEKVQLTVWPLCMRDAECSINVNPRRLPMQYVYSIRSSMQRQIWSLQAYTNADHLQKRFIALNPPQNYCMGSLAIFDHSGKLLIAQQLEPRT